LKIVWPDEAIEHLEAIVTILVLNRPQGRATRAWFVRQRNKPTGDKAEKGV
jgi:hypothetical protein